MPWIHLVLAVVVSVVDDDPRRGIPLGGGFGGNESRRCRCVADDDCQQSSAEDDKSH